MIKFTFFTLLFLVSPFSFAEESGSSGFQSFIGITGFFELMLGYVSSFFQFVFLTIPLLIVDFLLWIGTYLIWLKLYMIQASLEYSHSIALTIIDSININDVVNSAVSRLPSDVRQIAISIRFFDGLTLVIEAFITRIIYSMT